MRRSTTLLTRWTYERYTLLLSLFQVKKAYPALAVQIAFIGYRDRTEYVSPSSLVAHTFSSKLIELQDFTTNIPALRDFVAGVTATGGDDAPEEVHKGLHEVLKLRWTADVRLLIHFADAPAHGKLYCDLSDNFPDNDFDGSDGKVRYTAQLPLTRCSTLSTISPNSTSTITSLKS